ncbi:hypothetical protein AVMA1855_22715 [Acidovorax sp. SUPP1855]|uniref:hypothetical protein n=1 Tax=Acidovorax sp. SUPP1855 TaxID=431774 RepID=UPI0023DE4637|nr:hypothetical protein [Acidovorax sp. SUPP1855]GKS87017.1 hypothetical protein AVMA1855_22715 [Acidovorax sp. SUPP1855]
MTAVQARLDLTAPNGAVRFDKPNQMKSMSKIQHEPASIQLSGTTPLPCVCSRAARLRHVHRLLAQLVDALQEPGRQALPAALLATLQEPAMHSRASQLAPRSAGAQGDQNCARSHGRNLRSEIENNVSH